MSTSSPHMLSAALGYAGLGIPVFPVNGKKEPLTGKGGFHLATTDRKQIESWWSEHPQAGIGTAHFDVVDVDLYKPECEPTWVQIRNLIPEGTPQNKTGRGGLQFIFAAGTLRDGKIGPGVDNRYAGRNYIVLPPSLNAETGNRYEAIIPIHKGRLRPAPEFPQVSGSATESQHLRTQIDAGEKIVDGRNKAAWMQARDILRTEPEDTDLGPVRETVQAWVNANCGGDLSEVDVAKQVKGAAVLVKKERAKTAALVERYGTAADPPPAAKPSSRSIDPDHSSLEDVRAKVRHYLDVTAEEEDFILVALATAVSKALMDEEPLWTMLVGASGGGKTEAIKLLATVVEERVDELTRAGLLSWAPGKTAKKVGLLTRIPSSSLVTISDFSTVVTMGDREARARMFGLLRVVYDGRAYRSIGGQPSGKGDELAWEGHLTLLAGATPVVDTHTSFEGALGERWIMLRLSESDTTRARERARFVVRRADAAAFREKAQAAARALVLAARQRIPAQLTEATEERLVDVATFVAHARTGVTYEGQGKYRVVLGIPTPEEPTRLVGQLYRLARCAVALGLDEEEALRLATAAALDSVPLARMRALRAIADHSVGATVSDVQRALKRGNWATANWEIEALAAIGVVTGEEAEINGRKETIYALAADYRGLYESVGFSRDSLSKSEKATGSGLHIRRASKPLPIGDSEDEIPF